MQPAYERLADRLLPAVTVRMGRPRFLTAMALGACVCEKWDMDSVSADNVTPAWLVYEWFIIEAFVRAEELISGKSGIPGIQKVGRAIRNQRPVSLTSYLKTPTVFGFTGVFRRLGRGIGILTEDGLLDDGGYELLSAWGKDQGLDGIVDASIGDGYNFRERLRKAVKQGMEKGHTTPQKGEFWRELVQRLDPACPGPKEKKMLLDRILSRAGPENFVAHLYKALVAQNGISNRWEEAPFLRKLSSRAPPELKQLLTAIDAYESFSRVITDAFNGLRHIATLNRGAPVNAKEFSESTITMTSLAALGPSILRIRSHPTLLDWERDQTGLNQALDRFEGVRNSTELFDAILDYHELVQSNKMPGKRAWFERFSSGKVVVRSGYTLKIPPDNQGGYVHEYRIPTFSGFLSDLGAFR